jgi:hypothetical protein
MCARVYGITPVANSYRHTTVIYGDFHISTRELLLTIQSSSTPTPLLLSRRHTHHQKWPSMI